MNIDLGKGCMETYFSNLRYFDKLSNGITDAFEDVLLPKVIR